MDDGADAELIPLTGDPLLGDVAAARDGVDMGDALLRKLPDKRVFKWSPDPSNFHDEFPPGRLHGHGRKDRRRELSDGASQGHGAFRFTGFYAGDQCRALTRSARLTAPRLAHHGDDDGLGSLKVLADDA
ncbi:hypothetical protein ES705_49367 [subsurface metagenome]